MSSAPKFLRLNPIARLSMGVVALLISLVLLADMAFDVVPARGDVQRKVRQRVAESLTVQITSLLEAGDTATLSKTIAQMLAREPDIRGIVVRRLDGSTYLQKGEDSTRRGTTASTLDDLRVPILSGSRPWGEVHIRFAPLENNTLAGWLSHPLLPAMALLSLGGFILSYAYMRRAMHYLNPSATVPERVRKAFDALREGLVIVDAHSRIVLANDTFRRLQPEGDADLNGRTIDSLAWLLKNAPKGGGMPWSRTLSGSGAVEGHPLDVVREGQAAMRLLVNTSPIADNNGRIRGCMVTFDDVTAVHLANEELRHTMGELEKTRSRIEEQNTELRRLAERDPMTGCYNRRAFFQNATGLFAQAKTERAEFCCIMSDIDFFKKFNDVYGHAVGDEVIKIVARMLGDGLRPQDVLCRYGGEEFCIVLPNTSPEQARAVADAIRMNIQDNAKESIRGTDVMRITSSFGVASAMMGASSLEALIEQADMALYKSKEGGRNRVTVWTPEVQMQAA